MAHYKLQRARLIKIDQEIQHATRVREYKVTSQSLAAELEVSSKTILRDIEFLRDTEGAPVEYDEVGHSYYYTKENYRMPAFPISESELWAVTLASRALEQYAGTPLYRGLQDIVKKMQDAFPETITVKPEWLSPGISFMHQPRRRVDERIWANVAKALHEHRCLGVAYKSVGSKYVDVRTVAPYHMVHFKGEWYLIGHCDKNDEIRIFALSRITNCELLKKEASMPAGFDINEYFGKHFGIMRSGNVYDIRLEFSPESAEYALAREWGHGQKIEMRKNGAAVISFQSNHLGEVMHWILSWGSKVKVLGPGELRKQVQEEIEKMDKIY